VVLQKNEVEHAYCQAGDEMHVYEYKHEPNRNTSNSGTRLHTITAIRFEIESSPAMFSLECLP